MILTKKEKSVVFVSRVLVVCIAAMVPTACSQKKNTPKSADAPTTSALIITTDYQTGAYSIIDPVTRNAFNNVDMIHQDSVCRFDQITGTPFIVARLGSDAVETVTPGNKWSITNEFSVGAGNNPQDISVVNEQLAYVALYAQPYLLKVNPTTGAALGTVDLSFYADEDGIPEVGWLYVKNGKLYVLLQRLSRPDGFLPTSYSSMLILDAATGLVEKELRLSQTNPFGKLRFNTFIDKFVIVESGVFTTMQEGMDIDGAIEFFDPETETLSGSVITAAELGGDIVDAVVVSETKGYAVVGVRKGTSAETHIVAFNPATGKKGKTLLSSDTWVFNFIELTPDGAELWVADRTRNAPGIRIFSTNTDSELTSVPIDVGLPPFMICFANSHAAMPGGSTDGLEDTLTSMVLDSSSSWNTDTDDATDSFFDTNSAGSDSDTTPFYLDMVVDAPCADDSAAYGNPLLAANGVRGAGDGMGSLDVYSMRYCDDDTQKYVTLCKKGHRILNGPGADFVVFENGFRVASSENVFMEPLVIFLSRDGVSWVPFPFDYIYSPETEYSANPLMWQGFGGIWPVFYHEEDNPVDPFNFGAAGGDQFDLDHLPDNGEALQIKQNGFVYLKLMAATSVLNSDSGEFFPKDASSFDGTADVDGVYVRYTQVDGGIKAFENDTEEAIDSEPADSEIFLTDSEIDFVDTDTLVVTDTDCRDDLQLKNGVCIPQNGFDNYAGLVIDYGNGDGEAVCVGYDGPDEITGISLLQIAGVTLNLGFNDMAICGMGGIGCSEDGPDGCWCECSMAEGTDCTYWSYHQNFGDGTWEYSQVGAGERVLKTGELDGWYWGVGTPEGAPVPGTNWTDAPVPATFENICVF